MVDLDLQPAFGGVTLPDHFEKLAAVMSIEKRLAPSVLMMFAVGTTSAFAGNYASEPSVDSGATVGAVLLLAIVAVVMLKDGIGASASERHKDQAADEE